MKELIALAKQKPGELQYASAGVGSFQHLGGELFKLDGRRRHPARAVQGRRSGDDDVLGGHTKVMFSSLVQTTPHIKSGKLLALGTGGAEAQSVLPDVPTIAEAGVPGYKADNWWGIVAPAGTPPPIVERLHKALAAAQDTAEVHKQFASEGAEVVQMTPAEFGKLHGDRNGQVGTRRQRSRHQGGVTRRNN